MPSLGVMIKDLFPGHIIFGDRPLYRWSAIVLFVILLVISVLIGVPSRLKVFLFEVSLVVGASGAVAYALWQRFRLRAARVLFDLATALASVGEDLTERAERRIERRLEEVLQLSASGRARLQAQLEERLGSPPTTVELKRRIQALPNSERSRLSTFLVTVAAVEGTLPRKNPEPLLRMLQILGVDLKAPILDKRENSSARTSVSCQGLIDGNGEKEISAGEERAEVHSSSNHGESPSPGEQKGPHLDTEKVKEIERETREAARVLRGVFRDSDEGTSPQRVLESELDEPFVSLISILGERSTWPQEEFERIAEEKGIMPGFAREQLNEIAIAEVGEPLVEGDDPIELNLPALKSLRSLS